MKINTENQEPQEPQVIKVKTGLIVELHKIHDDDIVKVMINNFCVMMIHPSSWFNIQNSFKDIDPDGTVRQQIKRLLTPLTENQYLTPDGMLFNFTIDLQSYIATASYDIFNGTEYQETKFINTVDGVSFNKSYSFGILTTAYYELIKWRYKQMLNHVSYPKIMIINGNSYVFEMIEGICIVKRLHTEEILFDITINRDIINKHFQDVYDELATYKDELAMYKELKELKELKEVQ